MRPRILLLLATLLKIAVVSFAADEGQPVSESVAILATGPHERSVHSVRLVQDHTGGWVPETNSYVEVQSGMNVWSEVDRRYVEASDEIELLPDGTAVARRAQHRVIFSPTLDHPEGTIDLSLPDGGRLRIRFVGVALTDRATGRSVFVGQAASSAGQLSGRNQIVYPSASELLDCQVVYTMRVGSLEQDVDQGRLTMVMLAIPFSPSIKLQPSFTWPARRRAMRATKVYRCGNRPTAA